MKGAGGAGGKDILRAGGRLEGRLVLGHPYSRPLDTQHGSGREGVGGACGLRLDVGYGSECLLQPGHLWSGVTGSWRGRGDG